MIDSKKAISAFQEKFSKMSYDEREEYLKKMGFSFGEEKKPGKVTCAQKVQKAKVPRSAARD